MYEPLKMDWKLFQDKVKDWQESYMARLNQEYIELLSGEGNASDKFWKLDERIREDQKRPGVMLRLSKSDMFWDIIRLMKENVISIDDLSGFSVHLQSAVRDYLGLPEPSLLYKDGEYGEKKNKNGEISYMINEPDEAVKLFHELAGFGVKIPYQIISQGPDKGKVRVRNTRQADGNFTSDVEAFLRRRHRDNYLDHIDRFRTDDGRIVVTMNPYLDMADLSRDITKDGTPHRLGEYCIYASSISIYGNDTPTVCIWSSVAPEYRN